MLLVFPRAPPVPRTAPVGDACARFALMDSPRSCPTSMLRPRRLARSLRTGRVQGFPPGEPPRPVQEFLAHLASGGREAAAASNRDRAGDLEVGKALAYRPIVCAVDLALPGSSRTISAAETYRPHIVVRRLTSALRTGDAGERERSVSLHLAACTWSRPARCNDHVPSGVP